MRLNCLIDKFNYIMASNKFYRDSKNKVIGGVCSGLANDFNLDVALLRVIFVLACLFASFGFWLYIILWIFIPIEDQQTVYNEQQEFGYQTTTDIQQPIFGRQTSKTTAIFAGVFVILVGVLFLINNFVPIYWIWKLWPLILVGIGVVMIYNAIKKGDNNE